MAFVCCVLSSDLNHMALVIMVMNSKDIQHEMRCTRVKLLLVGRENTENHKWSLVSQDLNFHCSKFQRDFFLNLLIRKGLVASLVKDKKKLGLTIQFWMPRLHVHVYIERLIHVRHCLSSLQINLHLLCLSWFE